MKKVFITGGAGYIGSHCVISLIKNGYKPIILDNFSNSYFGIIKKLENITKKKITFYKVDLKNKKKLKLIFKKHDCYCVIHCAGLKSVKESTNKPIDYFENNVGSTLSLLECMKEQKIFKIIFSSSATVYSDLQTLPFNEKSEIGKTQNPYGTSKFVIEKILMDLSTFDERWSIRIARYFNPISNHCSGLIKENPKIDASNLMPHILKVAKKKLAFLNIFGKSYDTKDGTCLRDYIHVMDLASGHVAMLNRKKLTKGLEVYNFGTGKAHSVLEVIKKFEKYTGVQIPFKFSKRRKGDIAVSYCNPKKALKDLNWKAKRNLDEAMIDIKKII